LPDQNDYSLAEVYCQSQGESKLGDVRCVGFAGGVNEEKARLTPTNTARNLRQKLKHDGLQQISL
jgi:hypothetical protein